MEDNFDSAETSKAFSPRELNGEISTGIYPQTYTGLVSSGVLRVSLMPKSKGGGFVSDFASIPSQAGDFYLKVDIKNVQGADKGLAGLLFRTNNNAAGRGFYSLFIDQDSYSIQIESGEFKVLRPWTASPAIRQGQTNTLAVVGNGSNFTLFINDQKVDEFSDETYSQGGVGLCFQADGADTVKFDFDNFELRVRSST